MSKALYFRRDTTRGTFSDTQTNSMAGMGEHFSHTGHAYRRSVWSLIADGVDAARACLQLDFIL